MVQKDFVNCSESQHGHHHQCQWSKDKGTTGESPETAGRYEKTQSDMKEKRRMISKYVLVSAILYQNRVSTF